MKTLLIGSGQLARTALQGQVAVATGAGRGIGFAAARALAWLGARVIIAEIDRRTGQEASSAIEREMGPGAATFIQTDVGDEGSVCNLAQQALRRFGKVDIVLNNATNAEAIVGAGVRDAPIAWWDAGYRVNLRGPALLARAFLPGMQERDQGVFVCVSSSGAAAYMGPYEVFKTAQVELARTLEAELEGTGVITFTIGPGIVHTPGAEAGIPKLAPLYGKTVEEFYELSRGALLSPEAAGAGFAAAIALAPRFRGRETYSKEALLAAGISLPEEVEKTTSLALTAEQFAEALALCRQVHQTLAEQHQGWLKRPLFERAWMLRDFKNHAGLPVDLWLETLARLETALEQRDPLAVAQAHAPLDTLAGYYAYMQELARGYEKDPAKLQEHLGIVQGWQETARRLAALVSARLI